MKSFLGWLMTHATIAMIRNEPPARPTYLGGGNLMFARASYFLCKIARPSKTRTRTSAGAAISCNEFLCKTLCYIPSQRDRIEVQA